MINVSEKLTNLLVVSGLAMAGVLLYKFSGVFDGVIGKLADLNGTGATAEKAATLKEKITAKPSENPFDPAYMRDRYNAGKSVVFLTGAQKAEMAKTVYDATGFWHLTDQSPVVLGVFKRCSHKTQVSDLAGVFQQTYKQNILDYVDSQFKKWGMTTQGEHSDIFLQILTYVNKLPE